MSTPAGDLPQGSSSLGHRDAFSYQVSTEVLNSQDIVKDEAVSGNRRISYFIGRLAAVFLILKHKKAWCNFRSNCVNTDNDLELNAIDH